MGVGPGGGGATLKTPNQIANLSFWYEAGVGLLNNSGAQFDSGGRWLENDDGASLSVGSGPFYISFFFRSDDPGIGEESVILGKGDANSGGLDVEYQFTVEFASGKLKFYVANGVTSAVCTASGAIASGTWYFVEGLWDGTNIELWINRSLYDTEASDGSAGLLQPFIMSTDNNYSVFFTGIVDSLGIWQEVKTHAQRDFLYNSGNGTTYSDLNTMVKEGLIEYFNLGEISGIQRVGNFNGFILEDTNNVSNGTGIAVGRALLTGDAIFQWSDSSGNSHPLEQDTSTLQPHLQLDDLMGYASVDFYDFMSYLQAGFPFDQPLDIFIICVVDNYSFNSCILGGGPATGGFLVQDDGTGGATMYAGMSGPEQVEPPAFVGILFKFSGGTSKFVVNKVLTAHGDPGTNNAKGLTLGAAPDGTAGIQMRVIEVFGYAPSISNSNENSLWLYINNKFGLPIT